MNYLGKNHFNLLDCTLRDGGYYNNWDFSDKLIQEYINKISQTNIKFVELGFRNFQQNRPLGTTGYTNDRLLKRLKIPSHLKIGVMVNAGELKKNFFSPLKNLKRLFPKKNKKISFVRFACHFEEIFFLESCINWLRKNNIEVFINIMQISEIKQNQVLRVCRFLKNKNIQALYLADSLGSLNINSLKKLIKTFKTNWHKDLGLHAHNNLNLALNNSLIAIKHGFNWIDCTILGMGRGPGNLITEDILNQVDKKNLIKVKILKHKYFDKLKKQYKWGPNKFYAIAAKYKIHPTYIQEMLSDKRYSKKNYTIILKTLKKTDSRKYNSSKLFLPNSIYLSKPKSSWHPINDLYQKDILIIGPNIFKKKETNRIERFIFNKKLFVIAVNSSKGISEKFVNMRAICHPKRLISDSLFLNKLKTTLSAPLSNMPIKLKNLLVLKDKLTLDYGIILNSNKKISIYKNYCSIPKPLAVLYSICIAISGKARKIYLAGFRGFSKNNPLNDETDYYLNKIQKKYKNIVFKSITKTKYKIRFQET